VDVRIVAATARDLESDVAAGRFREDLYYRLYVIAIRLPPLAERREDIAPLVRLLLARHSAALSRPVPTVDQAAMRALLDYAWPGNVRELSNALERAVVLAPGGRIALEDLPEPVRTTPAARVDDGLSLRDRTAQAERDAIRAALARADGNRREAAALLGISLRSLFYKLKALGLEA
jgi:DNA-binding NtrC family response regulator